jgi:hypothetical protein
MGPHKTHDARAASADKTHAPLRVPTSNTGPAPTPAAVLTYVVLNTRNLPRQLAAVINRQRRPGGGNDW